jgi:hypothetical protein
LTAFTERVSRSPVLADEEPAHLLADVVQRPVAFLGRRGLEGPQQAVHRVGLHAREDAVDLPGRELERVGESLHADRVHHRSEECQSALGRVVVWLSALHGWSSGVHEGHHRAEDPIERATVAQEKTIHANGWS